MSLCLDVVLPPTYLKFLVTKWETELEKKDQLRALNEFVDIGLPPLAFFRRKDVDKNVGRFIVFIVWFSR